MATVRLENVDKVYGRGKRVLSDLSLEIKDHEFLVLVGPSGCGKSTVLRIIAGLEEVTAGTVWIGDRIVNDVPPKARDVAMVFQSYALYPHMTAYENISFGLRLRKIPKKEIDKTVRNVAQILGVVELLDKMPKQLSGGERQRIALGRAIVRNPQVFLFDEPLSNLDAKLRTEMRSEISSLHRRLQVTTVYVTHDQVEAMTMGERIVVLKDGIVQQIGEPLEIYQKPINLFVAGFIGSPQMNLFRADVSADAARIALFGTSLPLPESGRKLLTGSSGKAVDLGLRPENVHLDPAGAVKTEVTLVEPTGGESYVYSRMGNLTLVAQAPGAIRLAIGEEIHLRFDLEQAHFFNTETEQRIDSL
ncbi:MAG: sn-glycerol-3-phosphate ABC transporter ATP-binding protein UgpC [Candidatus Eisenbacteria bacterium]|uniref:Sn-glycerol-3-phosphate ABC transporter ATP-binding protein UgpC n=1 Tax=Eiseniibacteriota bacterium TaxID=2212470 RepID=A0A948RSD3_UNCEI|nr:sn-glycerol-3-phosphate ABC transporter ATP-binding protein UgpC [Candidatus Eisenbacteria bacterium]MBU1950443.1 sn-glycerol-3-phosphate ABC transporter ATP-binding protein UgpC [Candidatus Eisenbacteria bacterium]MBU2690110.1 sn-glycerol-3-phosphate ABC transporter ATP-binding protein UgpC [Candidatus Eisenbacteria bacterium]